MNKELWEKIEATALYVAKSKDAADYELDFGNESVSSLDDLIEDFFGDEGPSRDNFDAMVWAFGSYLAVVINKQYEGKWSKSEETSEVEFIAKTSGVRLHPFTWVAKKFDAQESIVSKYDFCKGLIADDRKS